MPTTQYNPTDMRDSLMASEGDLPPIRASVPLQTYIQYAYNLFKAALATSAQQYISRSYVAWKRFLSFIAHTLPQHPKYAHRGGGGGGEKFKQWCKEASAYAFTELERIVTQMDREEGKITQVWWQIR